MKSCLLCGVGGQGTVLASRIIAAAAMGKGLFARTAETIGMAQRGGSVVSHVRVGASVPSPLIPNGGADVLLGFEPGEVLRNLRYLKEGGTVITCPETVAPVTASLGGTAYDGGAILAYLREHLEKAAVLDTAAIVAACGSPRVVNMALLGALAESGEMGLTLSEIETAMAKKIRPRFLDMNKKALELGAKTLSEKR